MRKPIKTARASSGPSHILNHDYTPETGHLNVTFRGGRQYRYDGVDAKTAAGLKDHPSPGKYMHEHVIGKFKATKI